MPHENYVVHIFTEDGRQDIYYSRDSEAWEQASRTLYTYFSGVMNYLREGDTSGLDAMQGIEISGYNEDGDFVTYELPTDTDTLEDIYTDVDTAGLDAEIYD